ncbi:MAG: hypothetical protein Fur007_14020 [Rhodoferax sp.]
MFFDTQEDRMATRKTPTRTESAPVVAPETAAPAPRRRKALDAATAAPAPAAQAATLKKPRARKAATPAVDASQVALKPSSAPRPVLTAEQRNHYVSVAAFYIAERRGFTLGDPAQDWLEAEAEIDRLIASGHFAV